MNIKGWIYSFHPLAYTHPNAAVHMCVYMQLENSYQIGSI